MTTPEEALRRNDRYLREFVEALRLCPYAKTCRESGKLHRRVLAGAEQAGEAIREIEALPDQSVEVALLIFPGAPAGSAQAARDFEATQRLRDPVSTESGQGHPTDNVDVNAQNVSGPRRGCPTSRSGRSW